MSAILINVLTSLGLTDKEAKVYLACTQLGTSVVSTIGQAAGINRVTTYDILEKLKQRGMVSYYTKKKIKYFSSIDPEILLEEFEKRTSDLRSALPKFKSLTGEISHPRVRYFEGIEGIKAIYADTLTSKTEILNYSNSREIRNHWPNYDQEYVEKRSNKKIYLRGVCPNDPEGKIVQSKDKQYNREFRTIPPESFNFTNEINIYDDKVAIISFKDELIGMIIESIEIANSQRAIFDICWQFCDILRQGREMKNKLLEPIKHTDLKETPKDEPTKPLDDKNLQLF